jgi:hypothetical protein
VKGFNSEGVWRRAKVLLRKVRLLNPGRHQRDSEVMAATVTLTQRRIIMERVLQTLMKNSSEQIRISLTDYHGRQVINIRVYYQRPDGEWLPGRKGLAFTSDKLPPFLNAVQEAAKLLDEGGDEATGGRV